MKKKLILCVLLASCVLALAACSQTPAGSETASAPSASDSSTPEEKPSDASEELSGGEKWTGKDVMVEGYTPPTVMTQEQTDTLAKLKEEAIAADPFTTFFYQEQVAVGAAKPNMRKITVDEVREITENVRQKYVPETSGKTNADFENKSLYDKQISEEILDEIMKIQYIYDAVNGGGEVYYIYWPDADTYAERRVEIVFHPSGVQATFVKVNTYNDQNEVVNQETLFDSATEIWDEVAKRG